jgi:hypothetical protein
MKIEIVRKEMMDENGEEMNSVKKKTKGLREMRKGFFFFVYITND